jgi:hypothetical protein
MIPPTPRSEDVVQVVPPSPPRIHPLARGVRLQRQVQTDHLDQRRGALVTSTTRRNVRSLPGWPGLSLNSS